MSVCKKCDDFYRRGMYFAHRQKPSHLLTLGPAYVRNQKDKNCKVCERAGKEQMYFSGGYNFHIESYSHKHSLDVLRGSLKAALARTTLRARDANIVVSIGEGLTYTEIGLLFGISRQRVHQIAKTMGVSSSSKPSVMYKRRRDTRYVTCFVCGDLYRRKEWNTHASTPTHRDAITSLGERIGKYRRTG